MPPCQVLVRYFLIQCGQSYLSNRILRIYLYMIYFYGAIQWNLVKAAAVLFINPSGALPMQIWVITNHQPPLHQPPSPMEPGHHWDQCCIDDRYEIILAEIEKCA